MVPTYLYYFNFQDPISSSKNIKRIVWDIFFFNTCIIKLANIILNYNANISFHQNRSRKSYIILHKNDNHFILVANIHYLR